MMRNAPSVGTVVREVTHTEPAELLWQWVLDRDSPLGPQLYRVERWASLTP